MSFRRFPQVEAITPAVRPAQEVPTPKDEDGGNIYEDVDPAVLLEKCNIRPPGPQVENRYTEYHHTTGTKERMDGYIRSLQQNGYLGLLLHVFQDEKRADRPALRGVRFNEFYYTMIPVLAAMGPKVLLEILRGSTARAFLRDNDPVIVDYYTKSNKLAFIKSPVVYTCEQVNENGESPTVAEYLTVCDFVLKYCGEGQEEIDEDYDEEFLKLCVEMDNFILDPKVHDPNAAQTFRNVPALPAQRRQVDSRSQHADPDHYYQEELQADNQRVSYMTLKRAATGTRRYLRREPNASYESDYEPNHLTVRANVIKFFRALKQELEKVPEAERSFTRLARTLTYVGWAKYFPDRIKNHEKHIGSSILQCIMEVAFLLLYRKGIISEFYQMRTFVTGLISHEAAAAPAEVFFSVIADCYSWNLGGFAHSSAGDTATSTDRLKAPEWGLIADLIFKEMPCQANLDAEAAFWRKRLGLADEADQLKSDIAIAETASGGSGGDLTRAELDRARLLIVQGYFASRLTQQAIEYFKPSAAGGVAAAGGDIAVGGAIGEVATGGEAAEPKDTIMQDV